MSIKLNAQSGGSVALDAPTQTTSSADLTFKLPVADGSANQLLKTDGSGNLGFVAATAGPAITMVDCWGFTQSATYADDNHITNYWVRRTGRHGGNVGSAMTQSSGVFAFPQTGLYLIIMQFGFYAHSGGQNYAGVKMDYSEDSGSSYTSDVSNYYTSMDNTAYGRLIAQETLDVTTTNIRIKFQLDLQNNITLQGGQGRSSIIFIKYGDT